MPFKWQLVLAGVALLMSRAVWAQQQASRDKDIAKMLALGEARDLAGLEDYIRAMMPEWEAEDPQLYGYLMLQAVGRLASDPFGDRAKSRRLVVDFARIALTKSGQIALGDEVRLVSYAGARPGSHGSGEEWSLERRLSTEHCLRAWRRITSAIDPDWVNETTYWNMAPPGMRSATQPEEIEDPELRAQFEADLAENERKSRRNSEQIQARRYAETFFPWAKRYIAEIYSHPPYASEELRELLLEFVEDEQSRTEILNQVATADESHR